MSPRFTLNKQDAKKILKGAAIAAGGAIATYLLQELPNVNFGQYTPLIVALASVLLNALLKFLADQKLARDSEVTIRPLRDDEIE
ncbi:MAG: hypothetical protein AB1757_06760 [Acidobacteriota bacterium]